MNGLVYDGFFSGFKVLILCFCVLMYKNMFFLHFCELNFHAQVHIGLGYIRVAMELYGFCGFDDDT